jgi:hypothetical protein
MAGLLTKIIRRVAPATTRRRGAPSLDVELGDATFQYNPSLDGDADPGEIVWTWVPWEEDPTQGKDRPVVLFGRRPDGKLLGVPLTSKRHSREPQFDIGTGPWDAAGRPSYAKLDRVLAVDGAQVRREGAIVPRAVFDQLVRAVREENRGRAERRRPLAFARGRDRRTG